jgi:uncharacterized DUF497 family protein
MAKATWSVTRRWFIPSANYESRFKRLSILLLANNIFYIYNVHMNSIKFEWEASKAASNIQKHGITFEEARTVFFDERARLIDDPDHSESEERFILLGFSSSLRIIVVCHCYRSEGNVIRIISARKATTTEQKAYD